MSGLRELVTAELGTPTPGMLKLRALTHLVAPLRKLPLQQIPSSQKIRQQARNQEP